MTAIATTTEPSLARLTLRPYQQEAVEAVYDSLRSRDDNPCVVIPTGGGKTPVLAQICRDAVNLWDGRVLVLAHVKELLEQAADKLRLMAPALPIGVYSAGLGRRDLGYAVTIAGVQSVYERAYDMGPADLIIVDEAHLKEYNQLMIDSIANLARKVNELADSIKAGGHLKTLPPSGPIRKTTVFSHKEIVCEIHEHLAMWKKITGDPMKGLDLWLMTDAIVAVCGYDDADPDDLECWVKVLMLARNKINGWGHAKDKALALWINNRWPGAEVIAAGLSSFSAAKSTHHQRFDAARNPDCLNHTSKMAPSRRARSR